MSVATAQEPDSDLFKYHWELVYTQFDDMAPFEFYVPDIDPPISPYLIISEDLTFHGEGACNTFTGTFEFLNGVEMRGIDFDRSFEDCEDPLHIAFEEDYFSFFTSEIPFQYSISEENGEHFLSFEYALGGHARFRARTLAVEDFDRDAFVVFPNPVEDLLIVESSVSYENLTWNLYSVTGSLLQSKTMFFDNRLEIDVSQLSRGIYFIMFETKDFSMTKKLVKK